MSLRSKARRPGPTVPDKTRTSAHALDLDNYVPAYLTYLVGKISSSASATYRPKFGIGITDWRIMALLATEPWISAGRVCDVIGLDKAAVSRSVRGMKTGRYRRRADWAPMTSSQAVDRIDPQGSRPCTTGSSNFAGAGTGNCSKAFPRPSESY